MKYLFWSVEYLVSFIECFMSFVFIGSFNKNNIVHSKSKVLMLSTLMTIVTILVGSIKLFSAVGTIILFLMMLIIHKLYYRLGILKSFGLEISYYAVLVVSDFITAALISSIMKTSISDLFNSFSQGRIIASIASKCILIIICTLLNRSTRKATRSGPKLNIIFSAVSIIILMLCTSLYFYQAKNNQNEVNAIFTILFVLILLLVIVLYMCVMYFFTAKEKSKETEMLNRQKDILERSIKEQETTFALWRKSVHDYKNTILALDAMSENKQYEGITDFIRAQKDSFINSSEYIHTGNSTADTVINTKYATAKSNGISFTINARFPEKCVISDIELAIILGNLIDNAIEASLKEESPFIDIQISCVQHFIMIIISNKCTEPPKDTSTTKRDKELHGIGLNSIKSTIDKYNGSFSLEFADEQATATVMIPN